MGFSVSWLAVHENARNNTLSSIGLVETDRREFLPESAFDGVLLTTGWYVVWFNNASPSALKPESLRVLSAHTEVIACQIEEHSMVSTATCWRDGVEQWYVAHDAEEGLTNLEVLGSPPAMLEEIHSAKLQLQGMNEDIDNIFDVPLALAEELVGFRHDASFDDEEEMFSILMPHSAIT